MAGAAAPTGAAQPSAGEGGNAARPVHDNNEGTAVNTGTATLANGAAGSLHEAPAEGAASNNVHSPNPTKTR